MNVAIRLAPLAILLFALAFILPTVNGQQGEDVPFPYEDDTTIQGTLSRLLQPYTLFGLPWAETCFTYRVSPPNATLEQKVQESIALWGTAAPITDCGPVTSGEDVLVTVQDLPGGTAGQAGQDGFSGGNATHGIMIIDVQRTSWIAVVAHEFGHVMGIGHSQFAAALMAPLCCATSLHPDDIAAVQARYGSSPASTPTPGTPPTGTPTSTPSICVGFSCVTRTPIPIPTSTPTPQAHRRFLPLISKD